MRRNVHSFPTGFSRAAVLVFTAVPLILLSCGGDDLDSQDIVDDCADVVALDAPADGVMPDPGTDTAVPDTALTDDGPDTYTPDIKADTLTDIVEDPMDILFPGIRVECRPSNLGCAVSDECVQGSLCIAGGCEPVVEPADYDFGIVKVVSGVMLPPANAGSGFDLTGDGVPDNVLADTIGVYAGGTELVNNTIMDYMNAGLYTYIASFRNVPASGCGPLQIAVMPATGDLDMDGLPDESGEYQVLPTGFREDDHGPLAQINVAAMDGNLILTGPGESLSMKLPLPDGTILDIPVEGLRIRADINLTSPSAARAESVEAEVGGYVRLQSIVDEINRKAAECTCAGVQAETAPAELVFEAGELQARCTAAFDDNACSEATDGKVCSNLTSTCTALMVMSTLVDVTSGKTTNNSGVAVKDALSLSIYVHLAPATLSEPALAPDFGAIPDSWRNIPEADIAQDTLPVRLGVLINDYYDDSVSPVITEVTQGDSGGAVTIGGDGTYVVYTPQSGYYGFDNFSYTIRDALANTATAAVEVRVSTFGTAGCGVDVWTYCLQYCFHDATCSPDTFGAVADYNACADACAEGGGTDIDIAGECGAANRCMEICRVNLPCTLADEYEAAVATIAKGGEVTDKMPCGALIKTKNDACGYCSPGSYGPSCLPCPTFEGTVCGGAAICDDGVEGTGECLCGDGLLYFSGKCLDIDECANDSEACGTTGWCVNYYGGYSCFCQEGYVFDTASGECISPISACDPNPCLQDPLSPESACTANGELSVGFECDCAEGYEWDGDLGTCRSPADHCDPNLCERDPHSPGSCYDQGTDGFSCDCDNDGGYFWNWDAMKCIDPCTLVDCASDVHSTGVCTVPSMIGEPECTCVENYYWSYVYQFCWDPAMPCQLDPCARIDFALAGTCEAIGWNEFSCDCGDGYVWNADFDYCVEDPGNQ